MFELELAWWDLVLRAALIYLVLLVMFRISGRRTVGQFTPFDLLVVMLLSEGVSQGMVGDERSVTGGLIVAATLSALNGAAAYLGSRSPKMHSLLEGSAVLLGRDGHVFADVLQRQRLAYADVEQALREADCELADMRRLFLESDGKISVLKDSGGATRPSGYNA